MNCHDAEHLAALAASGDVTAAEQAALEAHLAACAQCRSAAADFARLQEDLPVLLAGEFTPVEYAGIRERVLREITPRRAWPWYAAAAGILLALGLIPFLNQPAEHLTLTIPQAQPRIAGPWPATPKVLAVKHHPRKKKTTQPSEPLIVKLITDDPNVVIIWLVDRKGE